MKNDIYGKRHHSIRNLRGLQVLRCGGLYKLTDFTLIDAFMFNELKEVYFARCNVSDPDLEFPFEVSINTLSFAFRLSSHSKELRLW